MMILKYRSAALLALLLSVSPVLSQEQKGNTLIVEQAYLRGTAPGAKVAGGYLTVTNTGTEADRLVGGSAEFAANVEIHEMKMDGATMVMRPVEDGVEVAPGGKAELKPGGYHLMLTQLREQLKAGEQRSVTLRFEKAGEIQVEFQVLNMGESPGQTN